MGTISVSDLPSSVVYYMLTLYMISLCSLINEITFTLLCKTVSFDFEFRKFTVSCLYTYSIYVL